MFNFDLCPQTENVAVNTLRSLIIVLVANSASSCTKLIWQIHLFAINHVEQFMVQGVVQNALLPI
jgi:hypothetical protein